MAASTPARRGDGPNPVRHQVAPAASHGAKSVPGGLVTTMSNPGRDGSEASASGPGRPIGNTPSKRSARASGLRLGGQLAATQIGIVPTGRGENSPAQ